MRLRSSKHPEVDSRPRALTATGVPLVAADQLVVHVDLAVRFEPIPPHVHPEVPEHTVVARWAPDADVAVNAVLLAVLRLRAGRLPSEELVADRAGAAAELETALRYTPGPSSYDVRVVRLEVSRQRPAGPMDVRIDVVEAP